MMVMDQYFKQVTSLEYSTRRVSDRLADYPTAANRCEPSSGRSALTLVPHHIIIRPFVSRERWSRWGPSGQQRLTRIYYDWVHSTIDHIPRRDSDMLTLLKRRKKQTWASDVYTLPVSSSLIIINHRIENYYYNLHIYLMSVKIQGIQNWITVALGFCYGTLTRIVKCYKQNVLSSRRLYLCLSHLDSNIRHSKWDGIN